jgi:leader peptidase (prepilin peptidase)/N-methyltransferase
MSHRLRKPDRVLLLFFLSILVISFLYVARASFNDYAATNFSNLQSQNHSPFSAENFHQMLTSFRFWDSFRTRLFSLVIVGWVFIFGASIGSFLNVVVYRIPIGESLAKRGSHCPHCDQAIHLSDNVPVFGWLRLKGRCRNCHLPISSRYPTVEAITGLLFVGFFLLDPVNGGHLSQVFADDHLHSGLPAFFQRSQADLYALVAVYLFRISLLMVLWVALLIQRDAHEVPSRLFVPLMTLALVASVIWPQLLTVGWLPENLLGAKGEEMLPLLSRLNGVVGWFTGISIGALLACRLEVGGPCIQTTKDRRLAFSLAVAYIGTVFGWQAVGLISLPLLIAMYFMRSYQSPGQTLIRYDVYGLLFLLTTLLWIAWPTFQSAFERQLFQIPFVCYIWLALLVAFALRFPAALPTRRVSQKKLDVVDPLVLLESSSFEDQQPLTHEASVEDSATHASAEEFTPNHNPTAQLKSENEHADPDN